MPPAGCEILGLAVEDVDFLRRVVHVRRQVQVARGGAQFQLPKGRAGGKVRDVPLSGRAAVILAEHIRQHTPAEVTLPFRQDRREAGDRAAAVHLPRPSGPALVRQQDLEAALEAAGMETTGPDDKVSMHALRHYAA